MTGNCRQRECTWYTKLSTFQVVARLFALTPGNNKKQQSTKGMAQTRSTPDDANACQQTAESHNVVDSNCDNAC